MMYRYNQKETGVPKRTRDILVIIICILILVNVVQFIRFNSTGSREDVIRSTLINRMLDNSTAAQNVAPQLGRMGGSSTMRWLSQTRQHLYGMTQINDLAFVLLGETDDLVPRDAINTAIRAIEECEQQLAAGLSMDTPLSVLWVELRTIAEAAEYAFDATVK